MAEKAQRSLRTRLALPPISVLVCIGVTALTLWAFSSLVDLKPKVDESFFFSKNDPQLEQDNAISRIFHVPDQIILVVRGEIESPAYFERIRVLSDDLEHLAGVTSVQSLSKGPKDVDDALKSPLWSRLLVSKDHKSSSILVSFQHTPGEATVRRLEELKRRFDGAGFKVVISGVPYVSELISRNLAQDLRKFTLAAICIFGVVLFVIFRSLWVLLGTFAACADSAAATLMVAQFTGIPIGPLTANLSTMVFVMTLSPMVFLTFNWKRIRTEDELSGRRAVWEAVKRTVAASFWSAVCMLLGFISLLFVPSTPMRQLGIAGAIGAAMAFISAYTIYPWFLERSRPARPMRWTAVSRLDSFFSERHGLIVAGLAVFTVLGALGLMRLNTDPDLPSYFKKGGDIRSGLDYVDRTGGSSPLQFVIEDSHGAPLDTKENYLRLWGLQTALERDPAVGNVVSIPLIVGEAKRPWYSFLFSTGKIVNKLEEPKHGEVARYFITPDRTKVLFTLRMHELHRNGSRQQVIGRLNGIVHREGFRTVLVGGTYSLSEQMVRLVTSSIISGVALLIGIFIVMGFAFSRSLRVSIAMLLSLVTIPVAVRGFIGYLGIPLDFITASAANLDLGMGVDAMIYLTLFARRTGGGQDGWSAWSQACSHLWRPIGTNLLVVGCGFAIFLLSNFPPTQHFGIFVIFGSATAATVALFMFPWLASLGRGKRRQIAHKPLPFAAGTHVADRKTA